MLQHVSHQMLAEIGRAEVDIALLVANRIDEVIVFHAVGSGGRAMEQLMKEGVIGAVFDYALGEISDELFEARSHRFPTNTPATKEGYLYRAIFEGHFPARAAAESPLGNRLVVVVHRRVTIAEVVSAHRPAIFGRGAGWEFDPPRARNRPLNS